jgi:hypothetical protein
MKLATILGALGLALVSLTAIAGNASATTLTSPSGTIYTSKIVAESEGTIFFTSAVGLPITCKKSKLESKVETHGLLSSAGGKLTQLTFEECSNGVATSPVTAPGSLRIHSSGKLTSSSAQIVFHGTLLGSCSFSTSPTGTDIGTLTASKTTGGNARLDISGVLNSACGNVVWEGSYVVTTPGKLEVD